VAFKLARRLKKHLTSVDKANVFACSRLWRRVGPSRGVNLAPRGTTYGATAQPQ
jgi:hypothetical protein